MGKFTAVSAEEFKNLQFGAGVLLKSFDPASPVVEDSAIICLTTGGISVTCTPKRVNDGADIDNVDDDVLEFERLTGWDCGLGFTSLSISPSALKLALGAADITDEDTVTKIMPRTELKDTDFEDAWWVGDMKTGGMAAAKLANAFSTGGLALKTTKDGKGNLAVTLKGFRTLKDPNKVPMEFYVATDEQINGEGA